jgi:hypothetical protein
MRESPDIDQLKRQARELLEAYRAQSPEAVLEVAAHHRTATPETFALHDAQFVLALVRVRELAEAEGGRRWRHGYEVAGDRAERRPQRDSCASHAGIASILRQRGADR